MTVLFRMRIHNGASKTHGKLSTTAEWFSTLDLVSGYWQVELTLRACKAAAFCTRNGLFQWNVMPLGLCNAPATFQQLMDRVLAGMK